MSQQGLRQASVRAVTGSAESYEGDWHRLFDLASISAGSNDPGGIYRPIDFNGRLLLWINLKLTADYTSLPEAMQALAASVGAYNFSSLGTFDASTSATDDLLLEDGVSFLLLEDDSKILLE